MAIKYWEQRLALRDAVFRGIENQAMGAINAAYANAARQIEREIKKIVGNYAFWKDLKKSDALKELKSLAPAARPYAARISRLEAIRASIKEGMEQAAVVQLNVTKRALRKVGEQAYYRTIYDIQKKVGMFGVGSPTKSLNQILRNNWSGEHWSARVWQNQRAASEVIQQTVIETLAMGGKPTEETYRKLFDEAMKAPGTTAKQATHAANRIIRTESAYVSNQESLEAYNEVGIEEYEFISVLDSRTSAICQGMDGKVFKTADAEVGVNYPPLHCFCRSITSPVLLSGSNHGTRYANNLKTGKGEVIPSDMKYQEWVKWQADGSPDIMEWRERGQHKIVNGGRIINWERRPDKYNQPIDDIINHQGFDGHLRLVTQKEYDKMIENGRPFMQRTYSAGSQAELDEYAKRLRGGEWYVDCNVGGAQYGQGMYTAASWDTSNATTMQGVKSEMVHYADAGRSAGKAFVKTETLTLDPSAKVIKYSNIDREYEILSGERKKAIDAHRESFQFSDPQVEKSFKEYYRKRTSGNFMDIIEADEISYDALENASENAQKEWGKAVETFLDDSLDNPDAGVKAAMMGYDAINAEGHGLSDSYTIVLNRTKVVLVDGN